jgi:hypothetical protein
MNPLHSDSSTHTSLAQLFSQPIRGMQVQAIEIPLIQRDYAQGRKNPQVHQIRERFIGSLFDALDNEGGIDLDFVFGDVVEKDHGARKVPTLYPLDGQQRLTTLFLLHCYLAWHIPETVGARLPWHAFSYATRPGARAFCEFLTQCRPAVLDQDRVSAWLKDQPAYLPTWKHDPTIQGMLVVLDALHARYRPLPDETRRAHWERLTDLARPTIRFHLLPIPGTSENNTLYVKMNSRGKPLTEFENFKAELEALMRANPAISEDAVRAFSQSIDTTWADLFWQYRGDNDLIDEECMRYLRFLTEVLAWKHGIPVDHASPHDARELVRLAQALFGAQSPRADQAGETLRWMTQALDVWLESGADGPRKPRVIEALFSQLFTREAHDTPQPLRVFNFGEFGTAPVGVNLFHASCRLYGTGSWKLPHTVMLYGVLQGLMTDRPLPELHPRLRLLRNLIEASRSEVRADATRNNMPALLQEVDAIMAGEPLTAIHTFNQVQVRNEQAKQCLLAAHPALQDTVHQLEDHDLLRGGLTAFDLDPAQDATIFEARAIQFARLFGKESFHLASAALLAKGNKGRGRERRSGHRLTYLGAPRQRQAGLWEDHWRIRYNEHSHPSGAALMGLLDEMAAGHSPQTVIDAFLANPGTAKDWRYYIARYEVMRGASLEFAGTYVLAPHPGYAICMPKSDSCDNRSYHHDGYLLALAHLAGITPANPGWPRCFPGEETEVRSLELPRSHIKVRCTDAGWEFSHLPNDAAQRQPFDAVMQKHPRYQHGLYAVPQSEGCDTEDRIALGAQLLQELVAAGL